MGGAWFERVALPFAGGAGEQPARLMQGLAAAARVADDVLQERLRDARRQKQREQAEKARKRAEG